MEFIQRVQKFFLQKIKQTESERKVAKLVLDKLKHKPAKLTLKDIKHLMICVNVEKVTIEETVIFTI